MYLGAWAARPHFSLISRCLAKLCKWDRINTGGYVFSLNKERDMDILNIIISLISGIVGGNVAGAAMQDKSLGAVGNSVTGLLGGGAGGLLLKAFGVLGGAATGAAAAGGSPEIGNLGSILGNIGGSGVGGAVLTIIVALIKSYMGGNK